LNATLTMEVANGALLFDTARLPANLTTDDEAAVRSYLLGATMSGVVMTGESMVLTAPLHVLNNLLSILVYSPSPTFYGLDELQLRFNDEGHSAIGVDGTVLQDVPIAAARSVQIRVQKTNQPISIGPIDFRFQMLHDNGTIDESFKLPANETAPSFVVSDIPAIVFNLSVMDPDAYLGLISVRLSVNGSGSSLRLPSLPASGPSSIEYTQLGIVFDEGSGYATSVPEPVLDFRAPIHTLNMLLANVEYRPGATAWGNDMLIVEVNDNGHTCGAQIGAACHSTSALRAVSFAVTRREYAPIPTSSRISVLEGSARNLITLMASDPNSGGNSSANLSYSVNIDYYVTSVTLTTTTAGASGYVVSNWGGMGVLYQLAELERIGASYGPLLFPPTSTAIAHPSQPTSWMQADAAAQALRHAPLNVSDPQGRAVLQCWRGFWGSNLLAFNFTAVKRITLLDGTATLLHAATNATMTIDVIHLNHRPYYTNGTASSLDSSVSAPVQFSSNFFADMDTLLDLHALDIDAGDEETMRFRIDRLPEKGWLYQVNDTAYDALHAAAPTGVQPSTVTTNNTHLVVRGKRIDYPGTSVASRHHLIIYVAPSDDPDIVAIQVAASNNPEAYNGYVFPTYARLEYQAIDSTGLQSYPDAEILLSLALPVVPFVARPSLNITAHQDQDVLLVIQPVATQALSVNFSAITVHSLPIKGQLYTRDVSKSALELANGEARLHHINTVPFTLFSMDATFGESFLTLIYAPPIHSFGSPFDSFTYSVVSNKGVRSDVGTLSINLLPINHAPQAQLLTHVNLTRNGSDELTSSGMDPNLITLNGTDIDGDALRAVVQTLPSYGVLYQVNGSNGEVLGDAIVSVPTSVIDSMNRVRYIANQSTSPAYFDSFLFTVSDGRLRSAPGRVDLVVGDEFIPPIARSQTATAKEMGQRGVISLYGVDERKSGGLTFIITRMPTHGTIRQLSGIALGVGQVVTSVDPLTGGRNLTYIPPSTRGYGPNFDSFTFIVRDVLGSDSMEATVTIDVTHVYQPAAVDGSHKSRLYTDAYSELNIVTLNITRGDAPSVAAVILSLPSNGGRLFMCSNSTANRTGSEITSPMLPVIAYSCPAFNMSNSSVALLYSPPPGKFSSPSLNDGVFESFTWSAYDLTTFSTLMVPPDGSISAPPEAHASADTRATLDIVVTFVVQPPRAIAASYFGSMNTPLILTLEGIDDRYGLPVRAFVNGLPSARILGAFHSVGGRLFQVDEKASELSGDAITQSGIAVTSSRSRIRYEPEFNFFGDDTITFFVMPAASIQDGSGTPEKPQSVADPSASPIAVISIHIEEDTIPPLISLPSMTALLEMNGRALIQLPVLSLNRSMSAAKPQLFITRLPDVGSLYQVRDTESFNYTAFVMQQRTQSLQAKLSVLSDNAVPGKSVTAVDGSVMSMDDINESTFPAMGSWMFNASNPHSAVPPVCYSTTITESSSPIQLSDTSLAFFNISMPVNADDLIRVSDVPAIVSHELQLLLYVPQQRQVGESDTMQYTLKSEYEASLSGAPASYGSLVMSIRKIYLPPIADDVTVTGVLQNTAHIIFLQGRNGNDDSQDGITVSLDSTPQQGGILCQLEPSSSSSSDGSDRPCGMEYGEVMALGSPVLDSAQRIVYMPAYNKFGVDLETFRYRVEGSDGTRTYTAKANVVMSVTHVNQPPEVSDVNVVLVGSSLLGSLLMTSEVTAVTTLYPNSDVAYPIDRPVKLTINATDPDAEDGPQKLRYFVRSVRGSKGQIRYQRWPNGTHGGDVVESSILYDFTSTASSLNLQAFSYQRIIKFDPPIELGFVNGSRLIPPQLTFDAGNTGGPVASSEAELQSAFLTIDYYAEDTSGIRSDTATIYLRLDCTHTRPPGAMILSPSRNSSTGASSDGSTSSGRLVISVWSNIGSMCRACPDFATCAVDGSYFPVSDAGYWRSDRFDFDGIPATAEEDLIYLPCTPSTACLSTPFFINASGAAGGLPCAAGFTSRLCASCLDGFYFVDKNCRVCSDASTTLLSLLMYGLPFAFAGALFLIIIVKLGLDFTWLVVTFETFQLIATLKYFQLDWPKTNSSTFSALGVLLINLDITQIECQIPEILYRQKWLAMMALPIAGVIIVFLLGVLSTLGLTLFRALHECHRRRKQRTVPAIVALQPHTDMTSHEASVRAHAIAAANKSLYEIFHDSRLVCERLMLKVMILMLNGLYLVVSTKAQEPLKCTRLADGSSSLDAQPSLSCDEEWYDEIYKLAVAASIAYAAGIPILFIFVLFMTRPPSPRTRPYLRGVFQCPVRFREDWRRKAFYEHVTLRRRDEQIAGQAELNNLKALREWNITFNALTDYYNNESYYWNVLRYVRILAISIIAIWLEPQPLYQATTALLVLWIALLLHIAVQPFKESNGVNELETVGLMALIGMLFCGLLSSSRTEPSSYVWVPDLLEYLITACTTAIGVAVLHLLHRHLERHGWYGKCKQKCGCSNQHINKQEKEMNGDGNAASGMEVRPLNDTKKRHRSTLSSTFKWLDQLGDEDLAFTQATYSDWFPAPLPASAHQRRAELIGFDDSDSDSDTDSDSASDSGSGSPSLFGSEDAELRPTSRGTKVTVSHHTRPKRSTDYALSIDPGNEDEYDGDGISTVPSPAHRRAAHHTQSGESNSGSTVTVWDDGLRLNVSSAERSRSDDAIPSPSALISPIASPSAISVTAASTNRIRLPPIGSNAGAFERPSAVRLSSRPLVQRSTASTTPRSARSLLPTSPHSAIVSRAPLITSSTSSTTTNKRAGSRRHILQLLDEHTTPPAHSPPPPAPSPSSPSHSPSPSPSPAPSSSAAAGSTNKRATAISVAPPLSTSPSHQRAQSSAAGSTGSGSSSMSGGKLKESSGQAEGHSRKKSAATEAAVGPAGSASDSASSAAASSPVGRMKSSKVAASSSSSSSLVRSPSSRNLKARAKPKPRDPEVEAAADCKMQ